ncbi:hypothetical protein [Salinicola tamaricis]|uniref:hypothetical protein n=1 Tax=Salinicola tamaricis TaxID=1771309 RepID=UPI002413E27C|nr:hypothetical protein [Salinicola tamaricis]
MIRRRHLGARRGRHLGPDRSAVLQTPRPSFGAQLLGIASIFAWVFIASLVVWGILKAVVGLRVSEEEEYEGVDIAECGMEAYPEFNVGKK